MAISFLLAERGEADQSGLWEALRSGAYVAVMRHALAPGTGDPANFALGDCSTQRNLSDEGRGQARRIGERFRAEGLESAVVLSSQWCRCLETAEVLGLGPVDELPLLNSFFRDRAREGEQTRGLKAWIAARTADVPAVLVTHQVNITALTGIFPASGEVIVLRVSDDGEIAVIGSFETE